MEQGLINVINYTCAYMISRVGLLGISNAAVLMSLHCLVSLESNKKQIMKCTTHSREYYYSVIQLNSLQGCYLMGAFLLCGSVLFVSSSRQ